MTRMLKWISCEVGYDDKTYTIEIPDHWIINPAELESFARGILDKISPFKQFSVTGTCLQYSEIKSTPYSEYNTIIELNIPYTLHLPDLTQIDLKSPLAAKVFLRKIWTDISCWSYDFDAVSDDPLYFKDVSFVSPKMPQKPSLSWKWSIPECKNVEEVYQIWTLRYTKMMIHFDSSFTETEALSDKFERDYLPQLHAVTLEIANKIITTYRNVMEEYSMAHLNRAEIMSIYFPKWNFWYYDIAFNLWDAMINRGKENIKNFIHILETTEWVYAFDLQLDNARSSLLGRDFKSVVLESFSAADTFVEFYTNTKLKACWKSLADLGVDEAKGVYWSTKLWLNNGCSLFFGKKFSTVHSAIWSTWCNAYKRIRNKVIHEWYLPNKEEADLSLRANCELISALKTMT